jgi:hypothetical protein
MLALPLESGYAQLQRGFAEALLFDDAAIPTAVRIASAASESRFGVYRNNVLASLINALRSRYPVTRKLLWPDTFDAIARLYILTEPPRSPVLLTYGEGFPQFLRKIGNGVSSEYIADIAALETARTRAYHAADAAPLAPGVFAQLPADEMAAVRLRLHPSVSLLASKFPVVSVWEANLADGDDAPEVWQPESALIARPHLDVEVWRLPPGAGAFFTAIAEGQAIGSALTDAVAQAPDFDIAATFGIMVSAGIVIDVKAPGRHGLKG